MEERDWYKTLKRLAGIISCTVLLCIITVFVLNFVVDKSYDMIAAGILQKRAAVVNAPEEEVSAVLENSKLWAYEHSVFTDLLYEEAESADVKDTVNATDDKDTAVTEDSADKEDILPKEEEAKEVKYIALTFDDGPHPNYTPRILDTLMEHDVKATFFIVGSCAKERPALVKQVYEQGHEVANHTYSHKNLTKLSFRQALEEIEKSAKAIEAACGYSPVLVRPPEGAMTKKLAKKLGYPMVFWTVDPEDWRVKDADAVVEHILENVKENCVILLHDFYESTADALELLIPKLKEEGFEFVTVSRLIELREAEGKTVSFIYQ